MQLRNYCVTVHAYFRHCAGSTVSVSSHFAFHSVTTAFISKFLRSYCPKLGDILLGMKPSGIGSAQSNVDLEGLGTKLIVGCTLITS